jgi:ribosome-binding factor A
MVRVNSLLQRVLAEELTRLADEDERLRLLTCTVVLCEPDLRHATVLFATLGADAAEALADHRRELQATIAAEVRLKRIPALTFAADPAVEAGERVEEALRRLHRPDAPPAP